MEDGTVSAKNTVQGSLSAIDPGADATCHVSAMLAIGKVLSSGTCEMLEAAGCPLAVETQKRLKFETMLAELSSRFVNVSAEMVDSQIEGALQGIVDLLEIDRSGLDEVSADGSLRCSRFDGQSNSQGFSGGRE
jgi:hypothetical protein